MKHLALIPVAVLAVTLVGACSSDPPDRCAGPVKLQLADYSITMPKTIAGPLVDLDITNGGSFADKLDLGQVLPGTHHGPPRRRPQPSRRTTSTRRMRSDRRQSLDRRAPPEQATTRRECRCSARSWLPPEERDELLGRSGASGRGHLGSEPSRSYLRRDRCSTDLQR